MEYQVIQRSYLDTFQEAMDDAIAQGWAPQGGVFVRVEEGKRRDGRVIETFYQAMVKDDNPGGRE